MDKYKLAPNPLLGTDAYDKLFSFSGLGDLYFQIIHGFDGSDTLVGGDEDDELYGGAGNDDLYGGGGNDHLDGGAGSDHLDGGDGSDTVSYQNAPPLWSIEGYIGVIVDLAAGAGYWGAAGDTYVRIENVIGSEYSDEIYGDGEDNVLDGRGGWDIIDGGDGHDTLIGGGAPDWLFGGDGVDTASYRTAASAVTASLMTGAGTRGDANGDEFNSIERLEGSAFDDELHGDDDNNTLWGLDGDDTLHGHGRHDNLYGGAGNDRLYGGHGSDVLYGGPGADLLDGGTGLDKVAYRGANSGISVDLLRTGAHGTQGDALGDTLVGITTIEGTYFDEVIAGDNEGNHLIGLRGDDVLIGNGGNNYLHGGSQLYGGSGNDTLYRGTDILDGGDGSDTVVYEASGKGVYIDLQNGHADGGSATQLISIENLVGSHSGDKLYGSDAANNFIGLGGDDELFGRGGDDTLYGEEGEDDLYGGNGNDLLQAGRDSDYLNGGAGADWIGGGSGNDHLEGGSGADRFVFHFDWGDDYIEDFEDGLDLIVFDQTSGVTDWNQLSISQVSRGDVLISYGGNTIEIENMDVDDFNANDFLFI